MVVIFEFGCRGCTYICFFTHSIHPFCKYTFLLPILSLYQVQISKRNRSTNFPTSFGSQKQAMQLFHTLTQTHLEADDKHSYEHSYGFYRKSFSTNLFSVFVGAGWIHLSSCCCPLLNLLVLTPRFLGKTQKFLRECVCAYSFTLLLLLLTLPKTYSFDISKFEYTILNYSLFSFSTRKTVYVYHIKL